MADEGFGRKLAAILSADVQGYSRLLSGLSNFDFLSAHNRLWFPTNL